MTDLPVAAPVPGNRGTRWPTRLRLLLGIVLLALLTALVRALVREGDLLALPVVVLVLVTWTLLALGTVIAWLVTDLLPVAVPPTRALALAAWEGMRHDPTGRRIERRLAAEQARLAPLMAAVARVRAHLPRLRRSLVTAVAVVLAAAAGLVWLNIVIDRSQSAMWQLDRRFVDLAQVLKLPGERAVMAALSGVGGTTSVILILAVLATGGVLAGRRRAAVLLVAISGLSSLAVTVLKNFEARQRPSLGSLVEASSSWPSGHSAGGVALALGICVFAWAAGVRRWPWVAAVVVPVGLLIGYSRAYLTVHWLSDVLSGWLVGAAATALVLAVAIGLERTRPGAGAGERRRGRIPVAVVAAVAVAAATGSRGYGQVFPEPAAPEVASLATSDPLVPSLVADPFSRTLLGREMEPVGLVIAADTTTLLATIDAAGWQVADLPTLPRLARTYRAGASQGEDPTAPMTPAFLGTRMQDLGIEQTVAGAGVSGRHHARLWRLPANLADGCAVWAVTASLDDGVEWTWRTVLPNHHIDPAVDIERDHVVATFLTAGTLDDAGPRPLAGPTLGTNAGGDPFFTDGDARVLTQRTACDAAAATG